MSQGTLYTGPVTRTLLPEGLIKHYNLDVTISEKDVAYNKAFPLGKLPAFIGPKGYKLTEVMAVSLYLANLTGDKSLLGKKDSDYYEVVRWMSFANSEMIAQITNAFKPLTGKSPYNKKQVNDALKALDEIVAVYEARLYDYTYLVGERLTLADLFVASACLRAISFLWGKEWRAAHPSFTRWLTTVREHPVLAELKKVAFIEKPVEYTPPKKEKKEKKEAAPKAAAPAEDAAPAEEKKPKHPLELLGKSTKFDLDEWKRTYSNEETREVALPWFWEHYDASEWSLWRVDYKYNDELTLTFMSNNLLGGFFNRLSGSTKYLFGSGVVYGENNNNGIVAVFLVRGDKHEPAFNVAPDWDSYSFQKLDASKPEDKQFVDDIFAWDKPIVINGETKEVADGKVFK